MNRHPSRRGVLAGIAGTAASPLLARTGAAPREPDLGPNVIVIDPTMPAASIQARLDAVFRLQETAHFTDRRYAILFKPGRYAVDCNVGYFTQVAGLGLSPDDVTIDGHVHVEADWAKGLALNNFWRSAENLSVIPPDGLDRWAASQAAPYRRMRLHGDLALDDHGWASGGFIADCAISGTVRAGTQQQYLTRSSRIGKWNGANWNMMFLGVEGAPADSFPEPPITTVGLAPRLREKPFLCTDADGNWQIFVSAWRPEHFGPGWDGTGAPGRAIPIGDAFIARPGMTARTINAALARGRHVILTPGVYRLDQPLDVTIAGTVLLGLGLATLMPVTGCSALTVSTPDDVSIAGVLIDAGESSSLVLAVIGPPGKRSGCAAAPASLHDLFIRIGGAARGCAGTALQINADHVFADNLWVWRADHGDDAGGRVHVGWDENPADLGVEVNGDAVTVCGLFVEHFRRYQTLWNGEAGRTFFYQSELAYDPPSQTSYRTGRDRGWPGYKVADTVSRHEATGLGVYVYFTADPSIVVDSAIEVPKTLGVVVRHATAISLGGGQGTLVHVVNDQGESAREGHFRSTLVRYPLTA